MDAVAVTDHGNMYGAVELQWKCGDAVKPIFGVEVWVVEDREAARAKPYHLVLLAESLEGYRNLLRLVSRGWTSGLDRRGRPVVVWEDLEEFAHGLIALTGAQSSPRGPRPRHSYGLTAQADLRREQPLR
jgi:DNA polymerase-3 subunit alpha